MTTNAPVPFPGTPSQAQDNLRTHFWWTSGDGETECTECCSKPWHVAAKYPCGTSVPRQEIDSDVAVADQLLRFGVYAVSQA